MLDIPLFDVADWRDAPADRRRALADRLDRAMKDSGFFMVSGHGIDPSLSSELRAAAAEFFALPDDLKERYRTVVGGRGWIRTGDEANAYYGDVPDVDKADLKETLTFGREHATGDADIDETYFRANVYPQEVPALEALVSRWAEAARALYRDLLEMLATALGLDEGYFVERAGDSPHTFNINRYPALSVVGRAKEGQYRIAPHTDWGLVTILDRQPGYGGLQVQGADGRWQDAPFVEGALTINIADLLARWTGDRWRSTRHRVLAPSEDAPSEELYSIIAFMEPDMTQVVEPLAPPVGGGAVYAPVRAADYFTERNAAASVS
ncbi:MAG: isopenicillin N synthase family dioxygenase [Corynebacterium sp.]|uniref:isopenicillin N synthase family dioxygenase n=1 Tax=Corynebacterium TaxID=1716 RepID=UPI0026480892|nr:2-oxoglutarate and iron-dependent oxygenase domain-containing protein [Corynebacterium sp.]MDN5583028.1 isopenicillin N synthase family oxygenase [Corynebacterium sp.]MDN5719837.1 isopenicillin N synthase family oxygenase [Corynebacterium sp.]MDN6324626.1 isopenicillin N synthase family oxygenase [Corynebacterium sp.]MDN6511414.1 isopenicillin N synthase family oxygenase [Corynebacterium sp.]